MRTPCAYDIGSLLREPYPRGLKQFAALRAGSSQEVLREPYPRGLKLKEVVRTEAAEGTRANLIHGD